MNTGNVVATNSATATLRFLTGALLAVLLAAAAIAQTQNGSTLNHQLNQFGLPICLGVSGNNEVNYDMGAGCSTGTLGSLLQDQNGVQYILSNAHVMSPVNAGIGDPIQHPGSFDTIGCANALAIDNTTDLPPGQVVTSAPGTVANLSACASPYAGDPCPNSNLVDAAIAQVIPGQVAPSFLDIPTFNVVVQGPILTSVVIKSGRTTARTAGTIYMVNVTIMVDGAMFQNQIAITPYVPAAIQGGSLGQPGDSGSLVLQNQEIVPTPGAVLGPVGLLFAGGLQMINGFNVNVTFANRIDDVINTFIMNNQLKLKFVPPQACTRYFPPGGDQNSEATESSLKENKGTQAIPLAKEPPPDPKAINAASKIKDRYTAMLMGLPNAVGTGVGLSDTGSRQVVIKLMVSKITDAVRRAVPNSLEGVPVEIEQFTNIHLL